MKKNVRRIDRYARIVLGIAAIGAGIVFQSWLGILGLIPLVTASIRWCPAYSIFRINTGNPFGKNDTGNAESNVQPKTV